MKDVLGKTQKNDSLPTSPSIRSYSTTFEVDPYLGWLFNCLRF
jgi:hypothetical protein